MNSTKTFNDYLKPIQALNSDINILLLGETGVGKSTFINFFANYISYPNCSLEEIEKNEIKCLIPVSFTITDENLETQEVKVGSDLNEDQLSGNSSTKSTLAYKFQYKERALRLIDTSGIGDHRGLEQDLSNFDNVISYIGQFEHLNSIWIMLKPNQSVLNVYFLHCLNHVFSRLEKTAASNVCFVFTNSRATNFKPGETLSILRKALCEIKKNNPSSVEIPCSKQNIFCLDNESFRYLIASKKGVEFDLKDKPNLERSFKISLKSCSDLLNYVLTGGFENKGLKPHMIINTSSVEEAKKVISEIPIFLVLTQNKIFNDLTTLEEREKLISDKNISINELQLRLSKLESDMMENTLTKPIYICTQPTCSEKYTFEGVTKYNYKKECKIPWYITLLPMELLDSPKIRKYCKIVVLSGLLIGCGVLGGFVAATAATAIGAVALEVVVGTISTVASLGAKECFSRIVDEWTSAKCSTCECPYFKHQCVFYESSYVQSLKDNEESIKANINSVEEIKKQQLEAIKTLHTIQKELDTEMAFITKTLAEFSMFLKNHSIVLPGKSYIDYINLLIQSEKKKDAPTNLFYIDYYKKIRNQYDFFLDESLKNTDTLITPEDVFAKVELLLSLKHSGENFKKLHKKHKLTQKLNPRHTMEYCSNLQKLFNKDKNRDLESL